MSIKEFGKLCPVLFLLWATSINASPVQSQVLGGEPVSSTLFPEVVSLSSGTNTCTGTIVGPRALLMAAHCIDPKNPLVTFEMEGRVYRAMGVISPYCDSRGHDLAVAVIFQDTVPVRAASISGTAQVGDQIAFLGYGSNDLGYNDHKVLRIGQTKVSRMTNLEIISSSSGPSLAQGDSGSPAFVYSARKIGIMGVGTSPVTGTNHFIRTDTAESKQLFNKVIRDYNVDICGVNTDC